MRCSARAIESNPGRHASAHHGAATPSPQVLRAGPVNQAVELLRARANPCAHDMRGQAALHIVCQMDRGSISRALLAELLAAGADVEQPTADRWRLRPLHLAARTQGMSVLRALLAFGASPLATSADGKRASAKASSQGTKAELRAYEATWEASAGPLVARPALVAAIEHSQRLMRVRELLTKHTSPNSTDRRGLCALHVACACADATSLGMLLKASADPNRAARDGSGRLPLHFAAEAAHPRCVRLLLAARADVGAHDEAHRLPLDYCQPGDDTTRALLMRCLLDAPASHTGKGAPKTARTKLIGGKLAPDTAPEPARHLQPRLFSHGPVRELIFEPHSARADGFGGAGRSTTDSDAPTLKLFASFQKLGVRVAC